MTGKVFDCCSIVSGICEQSVHHFKKFMIIAAFEVESKRKASHPWRNL